MRVGLFGVVDGIGLRSIAVKKLPPILAPRIIADLRSSDECGDPDHPALRGRCMITARVFFCRYRARDSAPMSEWQISGRTAIQVLAGSGSGKQIYLHEATRIA